MAEMAATAHGRAIFLICLVVSTSYALPQRGFPINSPSARGQVNNPSARGQVFSTSPPQYPIIPYSYGYEVQDPLTNNYQNKAEIKTANGDVYGSYSVLMPDGYIYTTTYNSTPATGFVSRLVKTLAILPQQLAAQSRSLQQVPQQQQQAALAAAAAKPQQFQLVKSQPQLPQSQIQTHQPTQQVQNVNQFQPRLPQPQQIQPQQQLQRISQPQQQQQQLQELQLLQQLQQLQLSQPQQVQSQQISPQLLQTQQPLLLPTDLHGPFRFTV